MIRPLYLVVSPRRLQFPPPQPTKYCKPTHYQAGRNQHKGGGNFNTCPVLSCLPPCQNDKKHKNRNICTLHLATCISPSPQGKYSYAPALLTQPHKLIQKIFLNIFVETFNLEIFLLNTFFSTFLKVQGQKQHAAQL